MLRILKKKVQTINKWVILRKKMPEMKNTLTVRKNAFDGLLVGLTQLKKETYQAKLPTLKSKEKQD